MPASESRRLARESLRGKWGKAALTMLVYALLVGLIQGVLSLIPFVGQLATLIISIPLSYGLVATFIKLKRGEETKYTGFFSDGFGKFAESWKVTLWTAVKLIIPIILLIVAMTIMYMGIGLDNLNAANTTTSATTTTGYSALTTTTSTPTIKAIANPALFGIGFVAVIAASIYLTVRQYLFKPTFMLLFDNDNMSAKEIVENSATIMNGNRLKWFCLELSFIGWAILACFTFGIGLLWLAPYMQVALIVFYEHLVGKANNKAEEQPEEVTTEE